MDTLFYPCVLAYLCAFALSFFSVPSVVRIMIMW